MLAMLLEVTPGLQTTKEHMQRHRHNVVKRDAKLR